MIYFKEPKPSKEFNNELPKERLDEIAEVTFNHIQHFSKEQNKPPTKIDVVKFVKFGYDLGLKQAKSAVEYMESLHYQDLLELGYQPIIKPI